MSAPMTVRMEANGPAGKGLEDWGGLPSESLVSGDPRQKGYLALDDKEHGVTAGQWECTPFVGTMGPWSSNEFMQLLEGTVTIVHQSGKELTVSAGECFFIPKGTVCQWKQPTFLKKFFVIHEDASGASAKDPASLEAIKIDTAAPLSPADGPDPRLVVSGDPKWGDRLVHEDPTGQYSVGVWSTTPYERKVISFPRHELMHILEGSVTISDGAGGAQTFAAGETLFVAKGAAMGWKNDAPVKKVYCIFLPKVGLAKSVAAE